MALGFDSTAWTDFVGAWFVWMLTFLDLDGGGRTLDFPQGREKGGGEEVDIFNK